MKKQCLNRMTTGCRRFAHCLMHCERGTQLVELAIVLPVLIVLLAATAEFGRFFYTYTTLSKAARSGARYLATAAVNATEDANAKNLIIYGNTAGTGTPILAGLTPAQIQITRSGGVPSLPQTVTVKFTGYSYQPIFNLGALTGNSSLSLSIAVAPGTSMRYLLTQPAI